MTATRILDKKGYQIFTISEAASIKDVIHELAKRKIGALIVTDVAGEGVGIISERDVIHQLSKNFLITHELQPALAGDTALEGFVPRPTRGAGSWRRDRISG